MKMIDISKELSSTTYPGRGIVIGKSVDSTYAVTAYFIMGRSENSRNRMFVEDGQGIRTEAFDPSKLSDPSLIIYAPVRVLGNQTIVTNGDQTDTIYDGLRRHYYVSNLAASKISKITVVTSWLKSRLLKISCAEMVTSVSLGSKRCSSSIKC